MVNPISEYIIKIKLDKYRSIVIYFLVLISIIIVYAIISSYKNNLNKEFCIAKQQVSYIKNIGQKRLQFIEKHQLLGSEKAPEVFETILIKSAKKNRIKVTKNDCLTENIRENFYKTIYEVEALAWHDEHIFNLIKSLSAEITHGFLNIENLNISRISNINTKSPAIKMELVCAVYYIK